ncbi:hypothetical protein CCC_02593 [Paramagnetospirillum magnetotacticum MS-1]|uniref:Uncharacterized protein n=1 Tax=Paramagnetospirillum magnetotacticum MS-1 TaxID=272627 RepID=A0A0C2YJ52_PARME|nr:hypothetical protein [Paramagnetospirillum magnetotacticum]KIL99804.1 hypothetical protein CCC_02593 [Paramagnetospirillum magnetotacticum MS-1]
MKYRWDEFNQLRDILEAEINGHHFDRQQARNLALTVASRHPGCAQTMHRIAERMEDGARH